TLPRLMRWRTKPMSHESGRAFTTAATQLPAPRLVSPWRRKWLRPCRLVSRSSSRRIHRRLPLAWLRGGQEVGRRGRSDRVYSTGQAEIGRVPTFGERAQVEPPLKLLS